MLYVLKTFLFLGKFDIWGIFNEASIKDLASSEFWKVICFRFWFLSSNLVNFPGCPLVAVSVMAVRWGDWRVTSGAGNCDPGHRSVASSQLETCVDQTCKQGFLTMFWSCYYSFLLRFFKVTDNRKLQLGVYPTILRERPLSPSAFSNGSEGTSTSTSSNISYMSGWRHV